MAVAAVVTCHFHVCGAFFSASTLLSRLLFGWHRAALRDKPAPLQSRWLVIVTAAGESLSARIPSSAGTAAPLRCERRSWRMQCLHRICAVCVTAAWQGARAPLHPSQCALTFEPLSKLSQKVWINKRIAFDQLFCQMQHVLLSLFWEQDGVWRTCVAWQA